MYPGCYANSLSFSLRYTRDELMTSSLSVLLFVFDEHSHDQGANIRMMIADHANMQRSSVSTITTASINFRGAVKSSS